MATTDLDGFTVVARRGGVKRGGRGRGRGRRGPSGPVNPEEQFASYQLNPSQKTKILLHHLCPTAENWFLSDMVCSAAEAQAAIFNEWWHSLTEHRGKQGLEVDPLRSALMYRSYQFASEMMCTNPFLQFVVRCKDATQAPPADEPIPLAMDGALPSTVVTPHAVAAWRERVMSATMEVDAPAETKPAPAEAEPAPAEAEPAEASPEGAPAKTTPTYSQVAAGEAKLSTPWWKAMEDEDDEE